MAKLTLLEMTQRILSATGGDEVNSIGDTVEASDVAAIIKETYERIITASNLRESRRLFNLDATSSSTPTLMTRPNSVDSIEFLRYNKRLVTDTVDVWGDVLWMDPRDFLLMIQNYDHTASNVASFTHTLNGFDTTIYYQNDKAPDWWTSFDDNYVVFDSLDTGIDTNLQQSKTSCWGYINTTFSLTDSYIPPLDHDQFDLLLQEAKSVAFVELKQVSNSKADKAAREGWVRSQKERDDITVNYGRRSRTPY